MKKPKTGNEEDLNLIKLIKNKNCNDSFERVREKHSNLFFSICNKFINQINLEEIYKDRDYVIFRAVTSFKTDKKAKFSTWLGNYTRYHCLNFIKKNHKYVTTGEDQIRHFFNEKSMTDYDDNKDSKDDIDHIFDILSKMNDKRIYKIFELRYLNTGPRLTWKQIAQKFDLTPQTIINLHMKGRRAIKRKMKNSTIRT